MLRIDGSGPSALDALAEAGKSVDAGDLDARLAGIKATDPATLIYTSGTTGMPKGCQLTHSNLVYEIRGAKASFPTLLDKGERLLVFLPLAHVLARAITIAAFANKVTLGFTSDIKNLVPMFGVFKPTLVVSVPRVFEKVYNTAEQNARNDGKGRIFEIAVNTAIEWSQAQDSGGPGLLLRAKHAVFDRLVYGKLRAALGGDCHAAISGGAPLGARLGHFYRGVGLTIYEGYGLTETSAAITVNQIDALKVGSVGKLLAGNSMRLGDDDELLVRGGVVFAGYWRNEEETKAVFSDGWFHTGDLGAIDDNGFLTIIGRKKEIIVTAGGKNVAPAILEDRLRAHPLISQAMCVGDAKPFIAALITIDPEAFAGWKQRNGKSADASVADLADDPDLAAEIDLAIKEANQAVSKAEAIRKFRILPVDFTEDTGELTPTHEGQAQGGGAEVRHRHRSALRQGLKTVRRRGAVVVRFVLVTINRPAAWPIAPPVCATASCRRPSCAPPRPSARPAPDRRVFRRRPWLFRRHPSRSRRVPSRRPARFRARRPTGRPPPAHPSPTLPGRRCRGPRRPGRRRGCGTASRTRRPSRGGRAARRRAPRR